MLNGTFKSIVSKRIFNAVITLSYLALFCFLVVSRAWVHFCCAPLMVWLALVLWASSFVQKSLFGGQRSCCFILCMSLDRSLRTWRISLIKPSLGHIMHSHIFLGICFPRANNWYPLAFPSKCCLHSLAESSCDCLAATKAESQKAM